MHEAELFYMARAIELARRGEGYVEPNPMVGCVLANDEGVVGEGWHRKFGGPHAEVEALAVAGGRARGATAYVTLEPCSHFGKTPPCAPAMIAAGVRRVIVAQGDPFREVSGKGLAQLVSAGVHVQVGLMHEEAARLNAPYLRRVVDGRPWVIAKWAMTLDGKIATHTGDSRWVSSRPGREIVHRLRGRMDAIIVGRGTAMSDDPLLTARPTSEEIPRVATRIIVDSRSAISSDSQLVRTAAQAPVLIAAGPEAPAENIQRLTRAGCEVFVGQQPHAAARLRELMSELGRRRMTNVLVEGGSQLLGGLFDEDLIDEVHVFIAPKLCGGAAAPSPIGGLGVERIASALRLDQPVTQHTGDDVYITGRVDRSVPAV